MYGVWRPSDVRVVVYDSGVSCFRHRQGGHLTILHIGILVDIMSESATMKNTQEAAEDVAAEQKYFEETYEACGDYMTYHVSPSSIDLVREYGWSRNKRFHSMCPQLSANHLRRMNFLTLPKDQRDLLINVGFKDKLDAVDEGIRR
jgi:hypothetical protein